jgi:hypothetical protein
MNCSLKPFKSFTNSHSVIPSLIGTSILLKVSFKGCKVSIYQARLEAREYFDKIREWNRLQVNPNKESLDPESLLIKEMALT